MKGSPARPQAPTAEELRQQKLRFYVQQRTSLAQGFVNCVLSNPSTDADKADPAKLVKFGFEIADAFLQEGFGLEKPKADTTDPSLS